MSDNARGLTVTIEAINLDGKPCYKICEGPYLVGYAGTILEVQRKLQGIGLTLDDVVLCEATPGQ